MLEREVHRLQATTATQPRRKERVAGRCSVEVTREERLARRDRDREEDGGGDDDDGDGDGNDGSRFFRHFNGIRG